MRKNLKKWISLLTCLIMVMSLAACGGKDDEESSKGGSTAEGEVPAYVTEPVTIEFWHTRTNNSYDALKAAVDRFNETNEYGITVVETYQGGYEDNLSKYSVSYGTDNNPAIVMLCAGGIETVVDAGVVADMSAYIERDNFDKENILSPLRYYMDYFGEDETYVFPYVVSTPLLFYNKAYFNEAPTDIEAWAEQAKSITAANKDVYGMAIHLDVSFVQRPILESLGATGLTTEDGMSEDILENGAMETFLTDSLEWVKGGYCMNYSVANTANKLQNALITGELASLCTSSAYTTQLLEAAKEYNVDLGVSYMVGYDGYSAGIGGASLMVANNLTDNERAAAWEFLKFLYEDEQVIENHTLTGYLPYTYSVVESQELQDFWAANPAYKIGYEQINWETSSYNVWSIYLQEWKDSVQSAIQGVLIDQTWTPKQGVEYLERQSAVIFP